MFLKGLKVVCIIKTKLKAKVNKKITTVQQNKLEVSYRWQGDRFLQVELSGGLEGGGWRV